MQNYNSSDFGSEKRSHSLYENKFYLWLMHHLYAAMVSLGRMSRTPFATLMTVAVISLSLALPLGLYVVWRTTLQMSSTWDDEVKISLFLKQEATAEQALALTSQLKQNSSLREVNYISSLQGWEDFKKFSGLGDSLQGLSTNPLPAVIEISPILAFQTEASLQPLLQQLKSLSEVESVELDLQWVKRLYAILEILHRAMLALGILFGVGVVLVVSHTIHLATEKYKEEIEVLSLVGGTRSFIRRPFLYTGTLYGLIGGMLAWLCVDLTLLWLQGPVDNLVQLYNSNFYLEQLNGFTVLSMIGAGAILGWIGSLLVIEKHIYRLMAAK